ncbi:MAG: alpha/beta hydrolase [Methylovulum sp.]|nr:alpha/beta hydrolase [Methylovulum sp.]
MKKLVIYNHGKDSIPWGKKALALALAAVAKRHGYEVISPDYQQSNDPDWRVGQLVAMDLSAYDEVVLVGSSMGAYVATVASEIIKPRGLFLIAPAFYLPGYQRTEFKPHAEQSLAIHGWQDSIVPPENAWRFCQLHHFPLYMLDGDHRLLSMLPIMAVEFERLLAALAI